jgi:putative ATPase subunit gpP of terminase
MNNDKKQQAKNLYFQTELTKTQIANLLQVSRRSLHYWIKEGNWERLKHSAEHLPSILAENCYHIIGHLTEHYLSEGRLTSPVSHKEADTLHKLAITIGKLQNRSTLNENMEMFGYFLDGLKKRNPKMAEDIAPYIDEYISARASVYMSSVMPGNFTDMRRIPWPENDPTEQQLDTQDHLYWDTEYHQGVAGFAAPTAQPEIPFPAEETPAAQNESRVVAA